MSTRQLEASVRARPAPSASGATATATGLLDRVGPLRVLALILLVAGGAIVGAMRTTSTTFDEIVLIAGGARGYATGSFDLAPDHPPLLQYVYGLPVFLANPAFPDESGVPPQVIAQQGYRYFYAKQFFWGTGNDAERLAFLGRLPAVLFALLLVVVVFAIVRPVAGAGAGLLGAAMVAFLPDVLGHGGVAYGDLPLALGFLAGLWLIDRAVRSAAWRDAAAAGLVCGLTVGVKISAGALVPAAVALIGIEAWLRRGDRAWRRRTPGAVAAAAAAGYLALVLIFRGDFLLEQFRFGLDFRYQHMTAGHGANAYLLGEMSSTGWWYYFPVAFLFKTSAGLHTLMLIAAIAGVTALVRDPGSALRSRLRAPLVGTLVFGAALLTSNLNIGFRYAMPVLPLLCVLTAVGIARFWSVTSRAPRAVIVAAAAWMIAFPLSYYPRFLSYISEYGPGRDRNHEVLIDSSLDWGQGLLELREFMREHGIPRIYLSYFGSALPAGYGIDYVPLASFFRLAPASGPPQPEPEYVVISATNLAGAYLPGDPFAKFREIRPDHVVANTMLVYRIRHQGD
jgi:hypothetical protein